MTLALLGGTPVRNVPFPSWPIFGTQEEQSLLEILRSGSWGGYNGKIVEFEKAFAQMHGARYGIACANGTVALEVALRSIGIECGDEVIVPPFTFVATATSVLLCHGRPVFADIDPDTLNLDPAAVEAAITQRTCAIVVVHFGGHPADMDALTAIAKKHKVALIEDCAHAHGATWGGVPVGTIGDAGTFSFQAFKLMTAGEGGMIVTNSAEISEKVWAYCNQGRKKDGAWFEHHTLGSNYRITAFQAAVLLEQLRRLPEQTTVRAANVEYFRERLKDVPGFQLPKLHPKVGRNPHYIVSLRCISSELGGLTRDAVLAAVRSEGIPAAPSYPFPLYRNPLFAAKRVGSCNLNPGDGPNYGNLSLPESERACKDRIWLEHNLFLGTRKDIDDLADAFIKIQQNASELLRHYELLPSKRVV